MFIFCVIGYVKIFMFLKLVQFMVGLIVLLLEKVFQRQRIEVYEVFGIIGEVINYNFIFRMIFNIVLYNLERVLIVDNYFGFILVNV